MASDVGIEVVFALPEEQLLVALTVADGTTVAGAIDASGIAERFPGHDFENAAVGIWGKPVDRSRIVTAGDRIELYRPLAIDPRQARRQRALAGETMASTGAQSEGSSS